MALSIRDYTIVEVVQGTHHQMMLVMVHLQSFTKYLKLTLVSCEIAYYGKSLISVFQEFFAITKVIFILAGRLGSRL